MQDAILSALASQGARLDAIYACPHHPSGLGAYAHPDHPARKPNPGMILRAGIELGLDLRRSWLVGDKAIDVEAAKRAALGGVMQVMTGYGKVERPQSATLATTPFEARFGRSIADAAMLPILTGP